MTFSVSRKKLSVSIREKNPSPLVGMNNSFKNTFPIGTKKAYPSRSLWKNMENGLCYPENSFSLTGMKHSLKNTFPQYGKTASSGKKIKENGFHQQENVFLLKIFPYFNNGFQHQRKSSVQKYTISSRQKISSHYPEWKIRLKTCFHYMKTEKIGGNSFH